MTEPSRDPNAGTPLWVKVNGAFVVLLVLIVVGMFAGVLNWLLPGGGHGMPGGLH